MVKMAALTAIGTGRSHRQRPTWFLTVAVLFLSSTMVPASADGAVRPIGKQGKPYVADADLALIAEQLAQENVKGGQHIFLLGQIVCTFVFCLVRGGCFHERLCFCDVDIELALQCLPVGIALAA